MIKLSMVYYEAPTTYFRLFQLYIATLFQAHIILYLIILGPISHLPILYLQSKTGSENALFLSAHHYSCLQDI